MPRLMSVAYTETQVRNRTKTVTRRIGWRFLKAGDRLVLCPKVMGLKKGEQPERITEVEVVAVSLERLDTISAGEVAREGFRGMEPTEFVRRFFTEAQGILPDTVVTRIEWHYLDACCDMHTATCEPPSELCCERCTEGRHPEHPSGVPCVLPAPPEPFRITMADRFGGAPR